AVDGLIQIERGVRGHSLLCVHDGPEKFPAGMSVEAFIGADHRRAIKVRSGLRPPPVGSIHHYHPAVPLLSNPNGGEIAAGVERGHRVVAALSLELPDQLEIAAVGPRRLGAKPPGGRHLPLEAALGPCPRPALSGWYHPPRPLGRWLRLGTAPSTGDGEQRRQHADKADANDFRRPHEHAPYSSNDRARNPLLSRFLTTSSLSLIRAPARMPVSA